MGDVLVVGKFAITDFEHVGIVPVARASESGETGLFTTDEDSCGRSWGDMSPVVRQRLALTDGPHGPDRVPSILAKAIDDGPSSFGERLMHELVGVAHHLVLLRDVVGGFGKHVLAIRAEVVFEVVHAPRGVEVGVLLLVAKRAAKVGAGLGSG